MKSAAVVIVLFSMCLFVFVSPAIATVTINEFVPHAAGEWFELYNASDSADYLASYYIDDDSDFVSDTGTSGKKQLSGIHTSSIMFPYVELTSAMFNNSEDYIVLFDADGKVIDQFHYEKDPGEEISIGRYPDNTGMFAVLSQATKGSANAALPTHTTTVTPTATDIPVNTPTKTPTSTRMPTVYVTPTPTIRVEHTPTPTVFYPPVLTQRLSSPSATPAARVLGSAISDGPEASRSSNAMYKIYIFPMLLISTGLALISGVLVWNKRLKNGILQT